MKASLRLVTFFRPGSRVRALEQRFQDELTIYVGRRSDSLLPPTRGQRPPLTDRDLERDAELQEVTRSFSELRSVARRDRRNLYLLWTLTTLAAAIGLTRLAWETGRPGLVVPVASVVRPSPAPMATPPVAAAPEPTADRPPSAVIAPPRVLREAASARLPLPRAPAPSAPAPAAAQGAARAAAAAPARQDEAARPRDQGTAAAPAPAASAAAAEAQKVFSIDGVPSPQPAAVAAAVTAPAPAPAARPASAAEEGVAKPLRRAKYGHAGVITLLEKGAVVFDPDRRTQRLVPVGGELPDGSILRAVDAKAGRVSTDRGEIQFVQ